MNEIYNEWLKYRTNYKHLKEWKTGLLKEVINAYQPDKEKKRGNVSKAVTGPAGSGKSTYVYKMVAKIHYEINGFTKIDEEEESYKYALDHLIFRPQELFNIVEKTLASDIQELIVFIDDASIHMGRQLFDQDRDAYRRLQGTVPTLRENFACVLLTTIEVPLLAKPWREFVKQKAIIQKTQTREFACLAKHYVKWYFPDDIRFRIGLRYQDRFSCLVPQPFYDWYHDKKMKALREYNEALKKSPIKPFDGEPSEEDGKL